MQCKTILFVVALLLAFLAPLQAGACTAITLKAKDGSVIQARTEKWGAFDLNSEVMVIPRNVEFVGMTPDGSGNPGTGRSASMQSAYRCLLMG